MKILILITIIFNNFYSVIIASNTSAFNVNSTIIDSERLEIINDIQGTQFFFEKAVHIKSSDFDAKCEWMQVVMHPAQSTLGITTTGSINYITAKGNVVVEQQNRIATSGRADIFPAEGKIIFSDHPEVTNAEGVVTGERITLFQDQSRMVVEGGTNNKQRPTITLPGLPAQD